MRVKNKSVLLASSWYVHEINVGVARFAREANWILDDSSAHQHRLLPGWSGDGAISLITVRNAPLATYLQRLKVPVVNLTSEEPNRGFIQVVPDNVAIGRAGAEELLAKGFKNFAFFLLDRKACVVRERMAGFRSAVLAGGGKFHAIDFSDEWMKPHPEKRMTPWLANELKKLPKPLGTMAQHDGEAVHLVRACELGGFEIPGEVAIVGADNDPIYSELGAVPLTSVVTNRDLLAYRAAEVLHDVMRGKKRPTEPIRVPPGGIVLRRSTAVFATEDPCIAKALAYIQGHLAESINIEDVVHASGASRRSLYAKFDRILRRSIGAEITRMRILKAKTLLSTTDMKVEALACACGFAGSVALSRVLKQAEGVAPTHYRRQQRQRSR